ncbi:hypothetical protein PHJA_001789200 [Phtheirospermum japonicum]|uniref:Uncharacterized protein n=1 Tax=Phtheirospermum japonicum TaxID=374723 RepID=A0A830CQ49_9LAMI|nr:hypothetical protein PHJA_001789200 [Phtheirospermum japonicum]
MRFKFHILIASTFSFSIIFICYLAPRFIDILNYFWPLLVSTALFLVAVVVFDRISPLSDSDDKSAEGLLDYVAGELPAVQFVETAPEVEQSVKAD